jgi:hypothetical protein
MTTLATRTLRAFDQAVAFDQGNAFRMWEGRVLPHMGDAYRQDNDLFRTHMGASGIGRDCARAVWYDFNWATAKRAEARMLRLWNRGHLEEARFIALLLTIGCTVIQQDENGRQFKISELGGHYGGSGDGMADGIPDLSPTTRALTEFKTHNDKSFKKLAGDNWGDVHAAIVADKPLPKFEGEGVRAAKFEHYVQMQQYMRKMGLGVGVYFAVNKNDDHIYAEVIPLDAELADKFTHRAIQIVPMRDPPKRVNESPSWFKCKFCDHRAVCHYGAPPERNCRTCEWSVPREDGLWWCENKERQMKMLFGPSPGVSNEGENFSLSKQRQLEGCSFYTKNSRAFK